jgi:lysine 2,3-aminomutase
LRPVVDRYPFRMSHHFLSLIRFPGDPIWRQAVPDVLELGDRHGLEDPLAEEQLSRAPQIVHRYPDRVLWLVSRSCALYCRFCTRKRLWRQSEPVTDVTLAAGFDYINDHREVTDVILSGGDPLLLSSSRLEMILGTLRKIPHVGIIRIGTRVPSALPARVNGPLVKMLACYHPLYMNIHFNHPWEITSASRIACNLLADAGIPLGSQTVLLKGVNDSPAILAELFKQLLLLRVRPYYLLQMDLTRSTAHFRTPLGIGLRIMRALRGHISGLAVPQFVVDLPGGHGKVPLTPSYVAELSADQLIFKDFLGRACAYPLLPGEQEEIAVWFDREEHGTRCAMGTPAKEKGATN